LKLSLYISYFLLAEKIVALYGKRFSEFYAKESDILEEKVSEWMFERGGATKTDLLKSGLIKGADWAKNSAVKNLIEGKQLSSYLAEQGKVLVETQGGKTKKAIYFHSMFEAGPDAIAELERTMRINDRVLRYLHTRLDVRVSLTKHMEAFKTGLQDTAAKEKEREAKAQARRAAMAAASWWCSCLLVCGICIYFSKNFTQKSSGLSDFDRSFKGT
jgi:ribosomal protein S6